eukprot:GGOE01002849.1.p1 GENE.GGOE01002849.1~~GGOE01002849.1.p1  ORF type:complete len:2155 (-),score=592.92 GGOE01002849.1:199-6243(-)
MGEVVGNLTSVDANTDESHTYAITGGPHASFFNLSNTMLVMNAVGIRNATLMVNVTSTDSAGLSLQKQLNITSRNVRPTDITLSSNLYTPPSTANVVIGTLITTDVNDGDSFHYQVSGGPNASLFNISGDKLVIAFAGVRNTNLSVNITSVDSGGLNVTRTFLIQTVNVPPKSVTASPPSYDPRDPMDYEAQLLVVDDNPEQRHIFEIIGGPDQNMFLLQGSLLRMDDNQLPPTRNVPLNITLQVTDNMGAVLIQTLIVGVINVAPDDIWVIPGMYVPPSALGLYVGTLYAHDLNVDETFTYSLQPDEPMFALSNGTNLTFKQANVRSTGLPVSVTVSDGKLNFTKMLTIDYINVAPTNVSFASGGIYTPPSHVNDVIGALSVSDVNKGQTFTFYVSDPRFLVDSYQLKFAQAGLRDPVYVVNISATDNGGLYVNSTLTFTSVNVPPYDITLSTTTWTPPSTANMTVATLQALDWNIEQNHTFTIQPGYDGALFGIVNVSILTLINAGENRDFLTLTIRADDGHNGTHDKVIVLRTQKLVPYSFNFTGIFTYYPPSRMNLTLGYFTAASYNPEASLWFAVFGGPDASQFRVDGSQLLMLPGQQKSLLQVIIMVSDGRRGRFMTLNVTALNVAPTDILLSSFHYQAPAGVATYVGKLTAVDANIDDAHQFAIYGGHDADVFSIVNGSFLKVAPNTSDTVLSVIITATDPAGAKVMRSFTIFAGACPPAFVLGPHDLCYKVVSGVATYAAQQSACIVDGYNSSDTIGQPSLAYALTAADILHLRTLTMYPIWLQACNNTTAVPAGFCLVLNATNACTMVACSDSCAAVCTVPMGSQVPFPFLVEGNISAAVAAAYHPAVAGAVVTFAGAGQTTSLHRVVKVDYFNIDASIIRMTGGAYAGFSIDGAVDSFQFLVSIPTNGTSLYTSISGGQAVGPNALPARPTRLQLAKQGAVITVIVTLASGTSVTYTYSYNMTLDVNSEYEVGLAMGNSGTGVATAQFSTFEVNQGAIGITQFVPSQGAVNVSTSLAALVIVFDRPVLPGAGELVLSYGPAASPSSTLVPLSALNISGTNLTYRLPTSLASGTPYYVELPEGLVLDVMSRDSFKGTTYQWTFITSPTSLTDISSTPNITFALATTPERFTAPAFCTAVLQLFPSLTCSQIEILSIIPGSVVVVFRINNIAASSVDSFVGIVTQAIADSTLSNFLVASGIGSIVPGSFLVVPPVAEEMLSLFASVNPSTHGFPTKVTIQVVTTVTGLPQGGYVELVLPTGFGVAAASQLVIRMESADTSVVQYCNASTVSSTTIGFFTSWPNALNTGERVTFVIEQGITMPSVCWGLNNWVWGVLFYDRLQSALSNFIIANSPYDQCDGLSAVRVNTAPVITIDPEYQVTNESTPLLISKPIKVFDDANYTVDARLTAELWLTQKESRIQLWPAQFNYEAVTIMNGTDNSSYIKFNASLFQLQYALANMKYYPAPHFYGMENLTLVVNDNGYCCDNIPMQTTFVLPLYVIPVNDAPTVSTPTPPTQTILEETNATFAFVVSDVDAGSQDVLVNVTVTQGTLAFQGILTSVTLDVDTATTKVLRGNLTNLNQVLSTGIFYPTVNFAGYAHIYCFANDLGNGPKVRTMPAELNLVLSNSPALSSNIVDLTVVVAGVNDKPSLVLKNVSGVITDFDIDEDTIYNFTVEVNDTDPTYALHNLGPGLVLLRLAISTGNLTSTLPMSATGQGDGSTVYIVNATIAQINAAQFHFLPFPNWNGEGTLNASLHDSTSDGGVGPSLEALYNITFTVDPVNDPPTLTLNPLGTVVFDRYVKEPLPVQLNDVDALNGTLNLSVSCSNGLVFLASVPGLTVLQGNISAGSRQLSVSGTLTVLQAALRGLSYLDQVADPTPIYYIVNPLHNTDTVVVAVTDNGNTGDDGVSYTVTLDVSLRITAHLWATCQEFLTAMQASSTHYCGCYFRTAAGTSQGWTKLPTHFPSPAFLSTTYPRNFMQGCCADMVREERDSTLGRIGQLGTCSN